MILHLHPIASEAVFLASLDICSTCLKRGATKRCTGCKCCKYCSIECQKLHWKIHKKMCPTLKDAVDGWTISNQTNLIIEERQTNDAAANVVKSNDDENKTTLQQQQQDEEPPGHDLYSQGLSLQYGLKDFVKGYPHPEKMGEKIERNPTEGNKLILEAAQRYNHKGAQYATALNYLPGGGLYNNDDDDASSKKEVQVWIERAAKNDHAEAQVTYGNKFWMEGYDGHHPVDKDEGLFWLRKALAHGVTTDNGGHPDLMGNALSAKSFRSTLDVALRTARQLFLTKYSSVVNDDDDDNWEEQIRICADCGVGAALLEAKSHS